MKALRVADGRAIVIGHEMPDEAGECLVRVSRSGICNTDLEIVRGYAGFRGTIGHEFIGVVEQTPKGSQLIGKRVAGEINVGCEQCAVCLSGDERHCAYRTVLGIKGRDGAHAEYLSLPERNLVEIPKNVSDERAVFLEPLAAACGIIERVDIDTDTKVAVIGDGKLGILCARSLRARSGSITMFGKHRRKLALAEKSGATVYFATKVASHARTFDVVVEASGSESGFACAVELVRPRGKIVLKSTFSGRSVWEPSRIVVDEISIVGSRCGRFRPALDLLSNGLVDVSDLVSDEFALSDGVAALDRAGEPGVMKVLLNMR
ncbi:MAG: MDR/zinc-dependent alcohol dehydrogenase-like family protein [Pyrinomonadaceae bacterium]